MSETLRVVAVAVAILLVKQAAALNHVRSAAFAPTAATLSRDRDAKNKSIDFHAAAAIAFESGFIESGLRTTKSIAGLPDTDGGSMPTMAEKATLLLQADAVTQTSLGGIGGWLDQSATGSGRVLNAGAFYSDNDDPDGYDRVASETDYPRPTVVQPSVGNAYADFSRAKVSYCNGSIAAGAGPKPTVMLVANMHVTGDAPSLNQYVFGLYPETAGQQQYENYGTRTNLFYAKHYDIATCSYPPNSLGFSTSGCYMRGVYEDGQEWAVWTIQFGPSGTSGDLAIRKNGVPLTLNMSYFTMYNNVETLGGVDANGGFCLGGNKGFEFPQQSSFRGKLAELAVFPQLSVSEMAAFEAQLAEKYGLPGSSAVGWWPGPTPSPTPSPTLSPTESPTRPMSYVVPEPIKKIEFLSATQFQITWHGCAWEGWGSIQITILFDPSRRRVRDACLINDETDVVEVQNTPIEGSMQEIRFYQRWQNACGADPCHWVFEDWENVHDADSWRNDYQEPMVDKQEWTFHFQIHRSLVGQSWTTGQAIPVIPPASASAIEDPHVTNIRGEHFDVWQLGHLQMLRVPFEASRHTADFLLGGNVQNVSSDWVSTACLSPYITQATISGRSMFKPITISLHGPGRTQIDIGGGRMEHSAETIQVGNFHAEPVFLKAPSQNVAVNGKTFDKLNVVEVLVGAVVIHISAGKSHLNIGANNLHAFGGRLGGLLGEDDHSEASQIPKLCQNNQNEERKQFLLHASSPSQTYYLGTASYGT